MHTSTGIVFWAFNIFTVEFQTMQTLIEVLLQHDLGPHCLNIHQCTIIS